MPSDPDPFDMTRPRREPKEHEFTHEAEQAFVVLHARLVRDVERARMLCGLLAMLGVALLRRLWMLGRVETPLALYALCAFAASGMLFVLSRRLSGGVVAALSVTTTQGHDVTYTVAMFGVLRGVFRTLWMALAALAALLLVALAVQVTRG